MDRYNLFSATILVAALSIPTIANSALVGRLADSNGNYQAYYDTEADLTWLADANYAMTSGYDSDGRMTWYQSMDWAASLVVGGIDSWRLPYTPLIDTSCNLSNGTGNYGSYCTGSEMGNLYYMVLSGTIDQPITSGADPDLSLFTNIQDATSTNYWSSESMPWGEPYGFNFLNGGTNYGSDTNEWYSWAVHDGDTGAEVSAIPIPASMWLLGSGFLGLIGFARRKTND